MEKTEFKVLLAEKTKTTEESLEQFLPAEDGFAKIVLEAMNYSVRAGGKRLRPIMMWESFLLCGGAEEDRKLVEPFMAALEMIHTYSLVHDDLPAMDNDRLRRGKPTTWAVYGETFGILAGDALLNFAFETAGLSFDRIPDEDPLKLVRAAKALQVLAGKAGIFGMIGGQTADILAEKNETLCRCEVSLSHKCLFNHILDSFDIPLFFTQESIFHKLGKIHADFMSILLSYTYQGLSNCVCNLNRVKGLFSSVSFCYFHYFCPFGFIFYYPTHWKRSSNKYYYRRLHPTFTKPKYPKFKNNLWCYKPCLSKCEFLLKKLIINKKF